MAKDDDAERVMHEDAERLRRVQEALRHLRDEVDNAAWIETLGSAIHELGLVRLTLDLPREGRRQHLRITRSVATRIRTADGETDAVIANLSIGGVGLEVDDALETGSAVDVRLPELGWVQAEVVATRDNRLSLRFEPPHDEEEDERRNRALLAYIEHHYE